MRKHFSATNQKAVSHDQTATETNSNFSKTASDTKGFKWLEKNKLLI